MLKLSLVSALGAASEHDASPQARVLLAEVQPSLPNSEIERVAESVGWLFTEGPSVLEHFITAMRDLDRLLPS